MVKEFVPNTIEYFQTAKENQFFDRKSARIKPDDIVRHLVAFANASGGTLVIGIENDGRITGFRGDGAHRAEEFKTVAAKRLVETPITLQVTEIAAANEKCFLQAIFPKSCRMFLENVASPIWRKLQRLSRNLPASEQTIAYISC